MNWLDIPGETPGQDIDFLLEIIETLPQDAILVELGTNQGKVGIAMALTGRTVYMVDIFKEDHADTIGWVKPSRQKTEEHIQACGVQKLCHIVESDSVVAGKSWREILEYPPVDFLFIDADHSYEAVKADLLAWLPNMKKNGIVTLHDFNNPHTEVEKQPERFSETRREHIG